MIKKILKGKTANTYIQLFRYLFAGGIAFSADVSVLYVLTEYAHVYYLLSAVVGFSVGLTISYFLSVYWIFDQQRMKNRFVELFVFVLIGAVGLGLTSFFMWFFTSVLLLYYLLSKIVTTVIVFVWNFWGKKLILFTKKN